MLSIFGMPTAAFISFFHVPCLLLLLLLLRVAEQHVGLPNAAPSRGSPRPPGNKPAL